MRFLGLQLSIRYNAKKVSFCNKLHLLQLCRAFSHFLIKYIFFLQRKTFYWPFSGYSIEKAAHQIGQNSFTTLPLICVYCITSNRPLNRLLSLNTLNKKTVCVSFLWIWIWAFCDEIFFPTKFRIKISLAAMIFCEQS